MTVRLLSTLCVGVGEQSSFEGYWNTHKQCERCSVFSVEKHRQLLEIWHQIIGLMRQALMGEHDFISSGENWESRNLRTRFQVVALSTSKCILDCAVSGMYVQGLALTRHLFETWQRIVYIRHNPRSAHSWLSQNGKLPQPPSQNTINNTLRKHYQPRKHVSYVEQRIRECDLMAHPSYAVITAHDTELEGFIKIAPAYDEKFAVRLISNAAMATRLILLEMPKNLMLTKAWEESAAELTDALDSELQDTFIRYRKINDC